MSGLLAKLGHHDGMRTAALVLLAVGLAMAVTSCLILLSGISPLRVFGAIWRGAFGSMDRVIFGLNKSTPYLLAGIGILLCFRAKIINIGADGQIALGGIGATWVALSASALPALLVVPFALIAGVMAGAFWALLAGVIHLKRGVHEVLCTLMLNFVGVLLVSEVLHGSMGEPGAGFPQSPLFARVARLPKIIAGTDLHIGILIAVFSIIFIHLLFWKTSFGFRLRILGASAKAALYVGLPVAQTKLLALGIAGGLAGLAGAIEVLGVHLRLIEGFSAGFGFSAVAVALLASLHPLAVLPAGLFLGMLEAGSLAMQREVGVPSSLVFIIQGLTMIFVLAALGISSNVRRA